MSDIQNKINRITDILRRDDGISGAMHYTEQISWVLFLKFLDDYELNGADEALIENRTHVFLLPEHLRWRQWACPHTAEGKLDVKNAKTGEELKDFVDETLFPHLKQLGNPQEPQTLAYRVGAIFEYLDNKIVSGHTLREVLDIVDSLNFQSRDELFELSQVYEDLLKGMGSDGGNSGEFYTPRSVIRAMVKATNPQVGDTVYDGAVGSAGFLVEAYEHMREQDMSASDYEQLQTQTFYGVEKTSLGYVMGMMNMILHGIESPQVYKDNTLRRNIRDIQESERHDVILANPPFGGKENAQIQQNFPVKSNATELLFLQHFMKMLKLEGKAAILIPEGILFQGNNAFAKVKQDLLKQFNLHTILSLPSGTFLPYSGVKTNVIFFDRKGSTNEIWYYEVNPVKKLTKNNPLTKDHLAEFIHLFQNPELRNKTNAKRKSKNAESPLPLEGAGGRSKNPNGGNKTDQKDYRTSVYEDDVFEEGVFEKRDVIEKPGKNDWTVPVSDIKDHDLSAKNPHKIVEVEHLPPQEILSGLRQNEQQIAELLMEIEDLIDG